MRAVQQNGLTTYKEVANVVSQVSHLKPNFHSKTKITQVYWSRLERIPIGTHRPARRARSAAKRAS
jgi:hypothetical protein